MPHVNARWSQISTASQPARSASCARPTNVRGSAYVPMFATRRPCFTARECTPRRAGRRPTGRTRTSLSSTDARELAEEVWPVPRQRRRDEHEQLVDQVALEERRRERRPAFEQERLHAFARERVQLLLGRARTQLELRPLRQRPEPEREPTRLSHDLDPARVEPRIVGAHGAHPDRDGVGPAPAARARAAATPRRRSSATPAASRARRASWPPCRSRTAALAAHVSHASFSAPRLGQVEHVHLDAEVAQSLDTPPGFGSSAPTTTLATPAPAIASTHGGVRAEPRARLERDVERRPARATARGTQRDHLGVGAAGVFVPALPHHGAAGGDHDGSDDGVRVRPPAPSLGELERPVHVTHCSACTKRR